MRKPGLIFIFVVLALLGVPVHLSAHPMGNFSISHYARINAASTAISVHAVLDYAEIPTFQLLSDWGIRSEAERSQDEIQPVVEKLVTELKPRFRLLIDGSPTTLQVSNIKDETTAGAGGLPTLRVSFDLVTAWKPAPVRLEFFDDSYRERIGWKEMVVAANPGFEFPDGNSFTTDRSAALTRYPDDPLTSAPNLSAVAIRIAPGIGLAQTPGDSTSTAAPARERPGSFLSGNLVRGDRLSEILSHRDLPIRLALIGVGIAFLLGALHAMSPGHGKTLVAAYLVGNRGTARHAIFLGGIVTFTHTVGVFLLGVITLFASSYIVPEKLYPWMGLISGLMIVGIGVNLFRGRLSRYGHEVRGHHHHGAGIRAGGSAERDRAASSGVGSTAACCFQLGIGVIAGGSRCARCTRRPADRTYAACTRFGRRPAGCLCRDHHSHWIRDRCRIICGNRVSWRHIFAVSDSSADRARTGFASWVETCNGRGSHRCRDDIRQRIEKPLAKLRYRSVCCRHAYCAWRAGADSNTWRKDRGA